LPRTYVAKEYKDIVEKFTGDEKKIAQSLLEKYLRDYKIETIADVNTLKEVIFYEVIQDRLQNKLNSFSGNQSVPIQLLSSMHGNSDKILSLKERLGLTKERAKGYDALKHLQKRFRAWMEENQASRTLTCPHCAKMILLKIRTEAWEAQKHPFFKDKVLYNKYLMELYHKGTVTKEDVAKVLECSPDYVLWLVEKIEKKQPEVTETKEKKNENINISSDIDGSGEPSLRGSDVVDSNSESTSGTGS